MTDIKSLIASSIDALKLSILVFGPQVTTISTTDLRLAKLQNKRIQIRGELEKAGHHVKYAEDLVDPSISGPSGNPFFQELLIMEGYDFIITIVDSPGSISEATAIALRPRLAQKSSLFLDQAYKTGLVAAACENACDLGAHFQTYTYPDDLDACNLLGFIETRVQTIQKMKFLL